MKKEINVFVIVLTSPINPETDVWRVRNQYAVEISVIVKVFKLNILV